MRVLLADDNALLLEGLRNMLTAADIEVVGTAENGLVALNRAEELQPDVILMDIEMPVLNGIEATRRIKADFPAIKVIILTIYQDDSHLFEAIEAGAEGYLLKGLAKNQFLDLMEKMVTGESPLAPGLTAKVLTEFARREKERETREQANAKTLLLTPRHLEILRHVASGLTYKEIGSLLGVSEAAIKYHMSEITSRLNLNNKSEVLSFAGKLGLLFTKNTE